METNRNHDGRYREDDHRQKANPEREHILNDDGYNAIEDANDDIAGRDKREEELDRVRHHQAHGIRHYESYRNHSSADDQPMTDTGA